MNKFNIGFKNANQTFRALVKLQLKQNLKKSKLIKLKPYFLFSNIFDRYPFSSSINSLDTIFLMGKKNNVIDENLYNSLDFSHKIAFHCGRLRSGSSFLKKRFLFTCINNLLFWGVKFCISFLDFLIINVYSFFYILLGINRTKKNKLLYNKKQNI